MKGVTIYIMRRLVILAPVLLFSAFAHAQRSESARIGIKRATDAGAAALSMKPVKTSVESLLQMARPTALPPDLKSQEFEKMRIGPLEKTVWQVTCTIKEIVLRADGDYYMVIEGDSGARTVVEVPDPRLCPNSKLIKQIQRVRNMLAKKFSPTPQPQKVNQKATVTGVGFFGFQGRNAQGARTNGARLMPGIDVKFE